jgi:hypothetical protein
MVTHQDTVVSSKVCKTIVKLGGKSGLAIVQMALECMTSVPGDFDGSGAFGNDDAAESGPKVSITMKGQRSSRSSPLPIVGNELGGFCLEGSGVGTNVLGPFRTDAKDASHDLCTCGGGIGAREAPKQSEAKVALVVPLEVIAHLSFTRGNWHIISAALGVPNACASKVPGSAWSLNRAIGPGSNLNGGILVTAGGHRNVEFLVSFPEVPDKLPGIKGRGQGRVQLQ